MQNEKFYTKSRQQFWLSASELYDLANCDKLFSHYKKSEAASSNSLEVVSINGEEKNGIDSK